MAVSKAENASELKDKRIWEIRRIVDRSYGSAVNDPSMNSEERSDFIGNVVVAYLVRENLI